MTIFRTPKTSHFNQIEQTLTDSTLDPIAKTILFYLLGKPFDWNLNTRDLKKTLGLTYYKVKKGLKILKQFGYITMKRLTSGRCQWDVYETPLTQDNPPQTRVVTPSVDMRPVENEPDIQIEIFTNTDKNNNTATIIEPPAVEKNVVVSFIDEQPMALPEPIAVSTPKTSHSLIGGLLSKLDQAQLTAVLLVYGEALKKGQIQNRVGYLRSLVQAVQNGTLTPPQSTHTPTAAQRIDRERAAKVDDDARHRVDNLDYFTSLFKKYGTKVLGSIPPEYRNQLLTV